jgi:diguanylate cyclase (GGDEF)-like protein
MAKVLGKRARSRGSVREPRPSDDPTAPDGPEPADAALVESSTEPVVTDSTLAGSLLAGFGTAGNKRDRRRPGDQQDPAGDRKRVGDRRDQAADRRDHAGDLRDRAGDRRDQAGDRRDHAGNLRDRAGEQRDEAGDLRGTAGAQRDQAARRRDETAEQRDHDAEERDQVADEQTARLGARTAADALDRLTLTERAAATDRRHASEDRSAAARDRRQAEIDRAAAFSDRGAGASERNEAELDRTTALADRGMGAGERGDAELDRNTALADRGASARERQDSSVDFLTGVLHRGFGVVSLKRELKRAKRKNRPLVLAFVDVDHLKAINDSVGHAGGDRMLVQVADTLRANLRGYDSIVRYGGDEFVFAIMGLNVADAKRRVALVNAALAESCEHGSVTVGLAQLLPDDSLKELVARADAALYQARQDERSSPG